MLDKSVLQLGYIGSPWFACVILRQGIALWLSTHRLDQASLSDFSDPLAAFLSAGVTGICYHT